MAKTVTPGQRTAVALVGFTVQVLPTMYVVATGTVPSWARWTLGAFVALWTVLTVARAGRTAS